MRNISQSCVRCSSRDTRGRRSALRGQPISILSRRANKSIYLLSERAYPYRVRESIDPLPHPHIHFFRCSSRDTGGRRSALRGQPISILSRRANSVVYIHNPHIHFLTENIHAANSSVYPQSKYPLPVMLFKRYTRENVRFERTAHIHTESESQ